MKLLVLCIFQGRARDNKQNNGVQRKLDTMPLGIFLMETGSVRGPPARVTDDNRTYRCDSPTQVKNVLDI